MNEFFLNYLRVVLFVVVMCRPERQDSHHRVFRHTALLNSSGNSSAHKKTWDRGQVKPLCMSVFVACVVFSTFMLSFVTFKPWPNIGTAGNGAGGIGGRTR
jgi:hypothetical protein